MLVIWNWNDQRRVNSSVLHNFHVYLIYDNVFSVHKHLTLNSDTQRHWLNYCPFLLFFFFCSFVNGCNFIIHCSQQSYLYTMQEKNHLKKNKKCTDALWECITATKYNVEAQEKCKWYHWNRAAEELEKADFSGCCQQRWVSHSVNLCRMLDRAGRPTTAPPTRQGGRQAGSKWQHKPGPAQQVSSDIHIHSLRFSLFLWVHHHGKENKTLAGRIVTHVLSTKKWEDIGLGWFKKKLKMCNYDSVASSTAGCFLRDQRQVSVTCHSCTHLMTVGVSKTQRIRPPDSKSKKLWTVLIWSCLVRMSHVCLLRAPSRLVDLRWARQTSLYQFYVPEFRREILSHNYFFMFSAWKEQNYILDDTKCAKFRFERCISATPGGSFLNSARSVLWNIS